MMSINMVGRLVKDIEEYRVGGDTVIRKGKIAVKEYISKDKGEHTSFIFFETFSEAIKSVRVGELFGISGSYRVTEYEKNEQKRWSHFVYAAKIHLFPQASKQSQEAPRRTEDPLPPLDRREGMDDASDNPSASEGFDDPGFDDSDDNVPF